MASPSVHTLRSLHVCESNAIPRGISGCRHDPQKSRRGPSRNDHRGDNLYVLSMTSHIPFVSRVAQNIQSEAPHAFGIAVVVGHDGNGWSVAVVRASDGSVVAWDGTYFEPLPEGWVDVESLEWDDWDDMRSKLLVRANGPWLNSGPLLWWVMPTYSFAREAGQLVTLWAEKSAKGEPIPRGKLAAYVPITETRSFEDAVEGKPARKAIGLE